MLIKYRFPFLFALFLAGWPLVGCMMPIQVACSYDTNAPLEFDNSLTWVEGELWYLLNDDGAGRLVRLDSTTGDLSSHALFPDSIWDELGYERIVWSTLDVSPTQDLLMSYSAAPSLESFADVKGIMIMSNGHVQLIIEEASNATWIDDTTIAYLDNLPPRLFRGTRQVLRIESIERNENRKWQTSLVRKERLGIVSSFATDDSNEGIWYETVVSKPGGNSEAITYLSQEDNSPVDVEAYCIQSLQSQQSMNSGQLIFSAEEESFDLFTVDAASLEATRLFDTTPEVDETHPAISPDGRYIAYVATQAQTEWLEDPLPSSQLARAIQIRDMRDHQVVDVVPIDSEQYVNTLIWSPNGEKLAFVTRSYPDLDPTIYELSIGIYKLPTKELSYSTLTN